MKGFCLQHTGLRLGLALGALLYTAMGHAQWQDLVSDVDALRRAEQVPAAGLVLIDADAVVHVAGLGDAGSQTPFRWGSITKTFTALALEQLVLRHDLNWSDPVAPLFDAPATVSGRTSSSDAGAPPFVNRYAIAHPLRLIHLAELSAGFTDLGAKAWQFNEPLTLTDALALEPEWRVTRWPPGLQHSYSNLVPGITTAVVERVARQEFSRFLSQHVLQPLNMPNASLTPVTGLPGGFKADGRTPIPYWHMTYPAFGALNANLEEMSHFLRHMLTRLRDDQVGDATSTLAARHGLRLGYGKGIYGRVREGFVFYGHGGDADGYRSRYGLLPAHGRGYLVVINTDNPALLRRMERLIEARLVADLQPLKPPATADNVDLAQYAGRYYPSASRFGVERWQRGDAGALSVQVADNRLLVRRSRGTTQLVPLGAGRFRRPEDPVASVVFASAAVDGAEALFMQGELGSYVRIEPGPAPRFLTSQ